MMDEPHFRRALLLLETQRWEAAEDELRRHLVSDSTDPWAHALLAHCLVQQERLDEAEESAGRAIAEGPDIGESHRAMAAVMFARRRFAEAEDHAREAVRLEPDEPGHRALLGDVLLVRKKWAEALEHAEVGLRTEAEHTGCTNVRAQALVRLGRREEAGETLDRALERRPEDSDTHANMGWTMLERGKPRKAMDHFREALRQDPENEWARQGILEAIKARNPLYMLVLKWFLMMHSLSGGAQWAVIIGLYVLYRVGLGLRRTNPEWGPWLTPVLVAYVVFALSTWIAVPLFNLALRLHPFGRLALNDEERNHASAVGMWLLIGLAAVALHYTVGGPPLMVALILGAMAIPTVGWLNCDRGWPRRVMGAWWGVMLILALFVSLMWTWDPGVQWAHDLLLPALGAYALMLFVGQFVANGLMSVQVRR